MTVGGQTVQVEQGTLTNSTTQTTDNWQWSARIDQTLGRHTLGGRFIYNDNVGNGTGQATPPGFTTYVPTRNQSVSLFMNSNLSPKLLNEVRASYGRFASTTTAADTSSESIPSVEITQLGLTGFNAASDRTAIGLAVNLPQFRFNNTYQLQDTMSWIHGAHSFKWGMDIRRTDVKSFFYPQIRGLLRYSSLQNFVDDVAEAVNINRPLPGGQTIIYYKWYDAYLFAQDTWKVTSDLTLNLGLRYERPGNAIQSLVELNKKIVAANGGTEVFRLTPAPSGHNNNFQPRFGFSWQPHPDSGLLKRLTGDGRMVIRGGYARANDYQFINLALNVASSFPFVAAISRSNLANAFAQLPGLQPNLTDPAQLLTLTRTVVAPDFRAPVAEQFSLEVQRELSSNTVFRVGWVATKGSGLFQTIDGNPRTICSSRPNCPRVDPTRGVIRLRANSSSSIYHSMQASADKRLARGFSGGLHFTWSKLIDDSSDTFNPSSRGEVAISQDSFNRRLDRGLSTYDRPARFATNFVYELPFHRDQNNLAGRVMGGWQVSSYITLQSGSPFSPLNGADPAGALAGIDGLVGNAIRPNVAAGADISGMSVEELLAAGGRSLFTQITAAQRVGMVGTQRPSERRHRTDRSEPCQEHPHHRVQPAAVPS